MLKYILFVATFLIVFSPVTFAFCLPSGGSFGGTRGYYNSGYYRGNLAYQPPYIFGAPQQVYYRPYHPRPFHRGWGYGRRRSGLGINLHF